jgi:16S rRNA processing protein RimM
VGCVVETRGGESVGIVRDVQVIGESILLVAEGSGGRGEILIPYVEEICVVVDPRAKKIVIDPPEGLLDLNEI